MWYDGDVRYMIRTGKECLDMELETKELLDLSHTLAGEYLAGFQSVSYTHLTLPTT